jgi:hypothetical protein
METSARRTFSSAGTVRFPWTLSARGFGDPAFDLAFCLNHLLLKFLWIRSAAPKLLDAFDRLASTYLEGLVWEPRGQLEARAASLLAGLLLARVDGKSPVEYLDASEREFVRRAALPIIASPIASPFELRRVWASRLGL